MLLLTLPKYLPSFNHPFMASIQTCTFNACSLVNKLPLFQSVVYSASFIICITESWLTDSIFLTLIVFYIRIEVQGVWCFGGSSRIDTCSVSAFSCRIRSSYISNVLQQDSITLCALYIPPNSDLSYLQSLLLYLSHMVNNSTQIIFLCDVNFPDIGWTTLTASSNLSNSFVDLFLSIILSNLSLLLHTPKEIYLVKYSVTIVTSLVTFQLILTYFIRLSWLSFYHSSFSVNMPSNHNIKTAS